MLCGSYAFLIPCESGSATTLGDTAAHTSGGSFSKTTLLEPFVSAEKSIAVFESDSPSPTGASDETVIRITPRRGSMLVQIAGRSSLRIVAAVAKRRCGRLEILIAVVVLPSSSRREPHSFVSSLRGGPHLP